MVHTGFRRRVSTRIRVRVPSGRLAVRCTGRSLVDRGAPTVVVAADHTLGAVVVATVLAAQCFDALFADDWYHD
jgi:hypothetical protein